MSFNKLMWKKNLRRFVPALAANLAGPWAGLGLEFLASKMGQNYSRGDEGISALRNMLNKPHDLEALEKEFESVLRDKTKASNMPNSDGVLGTNGAVDAALARVDKKSVLVPALLGGSLLSITLMLFFVIPPDSNKEAIMVIIGVLAGYFERELRGR